MLRSENRGEPPTFRGSAKIGGFLAANFSPTFYPHFFGETQKLGVDHILAIYGRLITFERPKKGSKDRLILFNMQNAQFLIDLLTATGRLSVKDKKYKENSNQKF